MLCEDLPCTVRMFIIIDIHSKRIYSYKWVDDRRCIQFHTNIHYMLYQSLYIMILFCRSYLHIMSFYVVTTLSIIAVTFSHVTVTTCFWQIFACRQFLVCTTYNGLCKHGASHRIGHDMCIPSLSSRVVLSGFFQHSRTMIIILGGGVFLCVKIGGTKCVPHLYMSI